MPPILGPATSTSDPGVTCPDGEWVLAGSPFPCFGGRDHNELRRLTLLAAC